MRKKGSCYFSYFLLEKKKIEWSACLAFTALWISLHMEHLDFCKMRFAKKHIRLVEVQLTLSGSKGQVSRETPATHPQPAADFIQFSFAFFWPAIPFLSIHKNSTLWHLMNKTTPWPEHELSTCWDFLLGGAPFHCSAYQQLDLCPLLTHRVFAAGDSEVGWQEDQTWNQEMWLDSAVSLNILPLQNGNKNYFDK